MDSTKHTTLDNPEKRMDFTKRKTLDRKTHGFYETQNSRWPGEKHMDSTKHKTLDNLEKHMD